MNHNLNILEKEIRAKVIKKYMSELGYEKAIVFTCGNASKYLKKEDVNILEIGTGDKADLVPSRWFTKKEINQHFPNHFDGTSGHLSINLMNKIAIKLRNNTHLEDKRSLDLPTGSGETLLCLKMAYPNLNINAHINLGEETFFTDEAPLSNLVKILSNKIINHED